MIFWFSLFFPLQLHAALSVSFWNGWYRWIFEHEGSVYSFGHYLRQLRKMYRPLSVLFVSKKVRYFWRRSGSRRKRLQKTGTIAKLSYLEWTELWTYPFVLKLVKNSRCNLQTFLGFVFFAMYFDLSYVFTNKERVESFKTKSWTSWGN